MKSYSECLEKNVFTADELQLLRRATYLVMFLSDREPLLRCHELARAMGRVLGLHVQDGHYGLVEHSWLWTTPLVPIESFGFKAGHYPNILDVYAVGQLPMVRLVSTGFLGLLHDTRTYRPGGLREDIDEGIVAALLREMAKAIQ